VQTTVEPGVVHVMVLCEQFGCFLGTFLGKAMGVCKTGGQSWQEANRLHVWKLRVAIFFAFPSDRIQKRTD